MPNKVTDTREEKQHGIFIDERRAYEEIYEKSVALDSLIEQYIDAGY